MAVKSIICRAHEVRAMLDGRQTQLRRIAKDVPKMPDAKCHPNHTARHPSPYLDAYCSEKKTTENPRGMSTEWHWWQVDDRCCLPSFQVLAKPGDLLWVRETWRAGSGYDGASVADISPCSRIWFETDDSNDNADAIGKCVRPSIHMPRWASRLTLRVTDVRVQRLREISTDDAIAEGIEANEAGLVLVDGGAPMTAKAAFRALWQSIHGPESWGANPWVTAYTVEVLPGNVALYEKPA